MDEIEELPASRPLSPRSEEPVWENTLPSPIEDLLKAQALLDDEFTPFAQCTPIVACGIAVLVVLILAILVFACVEGVVV
jgi:hypothetical protein